MKSSQNSSNTSGVKEFQAPLPGFKMEVVSGKVGWRKFVETTLKGRVRIHMVKER